MADHDLIFFANRNTPKVVPKGKQFKAPAGYGKVTKRRPATAKEEKVIARGDWLRVDVHSNTPGDGKYKGGSNYRPQLRKMSKASLEVPDDHPRMNAYLEMAAHYAVADEDERASVLVAVKALASGLDMPEVTDMAAAITPLTCPPCERRFGDDSHLATHLLAVHAPSASGAAHGQVES